MDENLGGSLRFWYGGIHMLRVLYRKLKTWMPSQVVDTFGFNMQKNENKLNPSLTLFISKSWAWKKIVF